jgi:3-oxoacyl-[acyl-carrier protein] reductase
VFSLKGKTAVITGAARGIGKAIAIMFAKAGARLILCDILSSQEAKEVLKETSTPPEFFFRFDVSDTKAVEEGFNSMFKVISSIDILVNNAGITRDALFLRYKEEDFKRVIEVNLKGAFNCTKAVIPYMIKRRWGRIINIASVVGERGNPGQAIYGASKAGLIAFTKTLAREYGARNITVNAVSPGYIETEMTASLPQGLKEKMIKETALQRSGKPEEVAAVVLFLASEEGGYITGEVIRVNGGMYM